jgi:hypothetical protein
MCSNAKIYNFDPSTNVERSKVENNINKKEYYTLIDDLIKL